jgi:predicted GIY-YIG superfamily endonuclease
VWYVYIIRSGIFSREEYVGATADLKQRLANHNGRKIDAHRKIQAMGIGLVLRLPGQMQSVGI